MKLLPFEYAVRNLGRSPLRLAAMVLASALVALLVCAAGAFARGMNQALRIQSGHENVILLGAGTEASIERSEVPIATAGLVSSSIPGLKSRFGVSYVSPEVHSALLVRESVEASQEWRALVRGVTDAAYLVHPRVEIVDGRAPRPGHDELLVGGLAPGKMGVAPDRLAVGQTLWLGNREWTISGRFHAPGTVMNAEIWAPLTDLQTATRRETLSCIVVTLDTATFADIDLFTKQRVSLELSAVREADYYAGVMQFYQPVRAMVWMMAALMSLAGLFGGLNTMYAAFAARVRETGMLQTLGFTRCAIVVNLVQESVFAACCGALAAAVLGLTLLDGYAVAFSMGVIELRVDSFVLIAGLSAGIGMGLVGALAPAWRCLRLPIAQALKAL